MDDLETWKKLAREHRGVTQELAAFIAGIEPGALRQPDLREKLQNVGVTTINEGPAQAGEFLMSEAARWNKLITAAKIRLE